MDNYYKTLQFSEKRANITKAIAQVQAGSDRVVKDSRNPHFKTTYASLTAVLEVLTPNLQEYGLVMIQIPDFVRGNDSTPLLRLTTILIHVESGEQADFIVHMPVSKIDAHGFGSALTYIRRYSLVSFWNMAIDDDDGNTATTAKPKVTKTPVQLISEITKLAETLYSEDEYADKLQTMVEWGAKSQNTPKATELKDLNAKTLTAILNQLSKK